MQKSIQKTIRLDSYVYNIINNYKDGDSFNAKLENLIKFCFMNLDKLEAERIDVINRINYECDKLGYLQDIISQYDYLTQEMQFLYSKIDSILNDINKLEVYLHEN